MKNSLSLLDKMEEATPPHMQDAAVSLVNGKQTDTGGGTCAASTQQPPILSHLLFKLTPHLSSASTAHDALSAGQFSLRSIHHVSVEGRKNPNCDRVYRPILNFNICGATSAT